MSNFKVNTPPKGRETVRIHAVPSSSRPTPPYLESPSNLPGENPQMAENAAPTTMIADLSHELKTPLSAVIGFSELLLNDDITEEQRETIYQIKDSADIMMSLVGEMLDYHRLASKKMKLNESWFDLESLIYQVVDLVRARICCNEIELLCDINLRPGRIFGDRMRMRQILLNLLSNAAKFTYEGSITVSTTVRDLETGLSEIVIAVKDTGVGFSSERAEQIFDPLNTVDGNLSGMQGGTGLGLTISRQLAELMGGCLTAQSDPGQGSVFNLHLFVDKATALSKADPGASLGPAISVPRKVLIVDDNPASASILARDLKSEGIGSQIAGDVTKAIHLVGQERFDIVLVDYCLAGDGCAQVATWTHQRFGGDSPAIVPLITDPKQRASIREDKHQYQSYLLKPVRRKTLLRKLSEVYVNGHLDITPFPTVRLSNHFDNQLKILVVEDDGPTRSAMIQMIDNLGHIVDEAGSGQEAAGLALVHPYDLILMDLNTPGASGIQTAKFLRTRNVATPIVAMTAANDLSQKKACQEGGMSDYVSKPITSAVMVDIIERHTSVMTGPAAQKDLRVMFLSSDASLLQLMKNTLYEKAPSAHVRTPKNPLGACVEIGSFRPHLLVIDRDLAEIDTQKLVTFLREDERYTSMQILVTASDANIHDTVHCEPLFTGASGMLKAPFGRQTFTDMLRTLLGENSPSNNNTFSSNDASIEELAAAMDVRPKEYVNLIEQVIESGDKRIGRIEHALKNSDFATAKAEAHTLRGSALSFRLQKMAGAASRIEEGARGNNLNTVTANLTTLKQSIAELKELIATTKH